MSSVYLLPRKVAMDAYWVSSGRGVSLVKECCTSLAR